MTLEESKEVIPMMEAMITQIEEQQNIMAEMLQEIQEKDEKLMCFQEQEERLQQLESELSELLQILPNTEELLMLLEEKTDQIQKLTDENQQWQELAQKLNSENRLLQKQNSELFELEQQLEKGRSIDERIKKLKERRSTGRVASADRADAGRTRPERQDYPGTENAARRIADLEREVKQREQSREHSSLKERLEENKRIVAERERENARCRNHDRGMSR